MRIFCTQHEMWSIPRRWKSIRVEIWKYLPFMFFSDCFWEKVGGTKDTLSPTLQKVGGTCPLIPPPSYAHGYDQDVSLIFLNVTQKRVNWFWRNSNWIFFSIPSNDTVRINSLEVILKKIFKNSWEPFFQWYLPRISEYLSKYNFQRIDFCCVFRWNTKQYAFQISSKSVDAFPS